MLVRVILLGVRAWTRVMIGVEADEENGSQSDTG